MANYKKLILFVSLSIFLLFIDLVYCYQTGEIRFLTYIIQTKHQELTKNDIKVFVISLDRTPERYIRVQQQLAKDKIIHSRFSAIDGYDIKIVDKNTYTTFFGKDLKKGITSLIPGNVYDVYTPSGIIKHISKLVTDYNISHTMSAGELGCFISHREIWNLMIEKNIDYALVLEDDITLISDFNTRYESILKNLPKEWDIIYLFVTTNPLKETYTILNNSNLRKISADKLDVTSTAAYLINKAAAKKLYNLSSEFSVAVDDFISDQINSLKISAYKTSTSCLTTPIGLKPEDSTIYQMGRPHY
jgi:glycosyl transferase family 25